MQFSTFLGLTALVASITASPITERQDEIIIIFKLYTDVTRCSNSPSSDDWRSSVSGKKSQAEAGECHQLNPPDGWDGVKMEWKYREPDYNFTTTVYTSDDCTTEGDDQSASLTDRVCIGDTKNYKSWKIVKN
jgi:hypothetical protein